MALALAKTLILQKRSLQIRTIVTPLSDHSSLINIRIIGAAPEFLRCGEAGYSGV
jgi:hypothetical protein